MNTEGYAAFFFKGPIHNFGLYLGRNPARIYTRPEKHAHAFVIDNAGSGDPRGHVENLNVANRIIVP